LRGCTGYDDEEVPDGAPVIHIPWHFGNLSSVHIRMVSRNTQGFEIFLHGGLIGVCGCTGYDYREVPDGAASQHSMRPL